jgi:hypothetical protein
MAYGNGVTTILKGVGPSGAEMTRPPLYLLLLFTNKRGKIWSDPYGNIGQVINYFITG